MFTAEISIGELIDKISILKVKQQNISNEEKLKKIKIELNILENVICNLDYFAIKDLAEELFVINSKIWIFEDHVRKCIKNNDKEGIVFNSINICRSNDYRFELKNKINIIFNSNINEVKDHIKY